MAHRTVAHGERRAVRDLTPASPGGVGCIPDHPPGRVCWERVRVAFRAAPHEAHRGQWPRNPVAGGRPSLCLPGAERSAATLVDQHPFRAVAGPGDGGNGESFGAATASVPQSHGHVRHSLRRSLLVPVGSCHESRYARGTGVRQSERRCRMDCGVAGAGLGFDRGIVPRVAGSAPHKRRDMRPAARLATGLACGGHVAVYRDLSDAIGVLAFRLNGSLHGTFVKSLHHEQRRCTG